MSGSQVEQTGDARGLQEADLYTIRGSTGQGDTESGVPVARNKSIIMSRKMCSPREVPSFCWQEEAEGTNDQQKAIGDQRTHHAKPGPAPGGHLFR